MSVRKIDTQFDPPSNNLGFRHIDERRPYTDLGLALHTRLRPQVGHGLEGTDELGTAIRIAAVIESVDADEDIVGSQNLRPS
jgi:hypothetical protein